MTPSLQQLLRQRRQKTMRRKVADFEPPRLVQPLIIVSAPRAGSTLLFETLAHFPDLWTIGEESHEIIEGIPALHPAAHGFASNRLTAADATPEVRASLQDRFARQLQDRGGRQLIDLPSTERPAQLRLLEKTPKNALRIPFLRALFPDAHFLFLYRDPAENISSILEGWLSQRFIAYRALPGWPHGSWSFLLPPGWETLREKSVVEIAAYQWQMANTTIVEDLAALPRTAWSLVRYTDLVREPRQTIQRIAQFAALPWDHQVEQHVAQSLPHSSMTLSAPAADKWRKHAGQLAPLLPALEPLIRQVEALTGEGK
jgi:hypothetical protein